jgi:hypothetical protein
VELLRGDETLNADTSTCSRFLLKLEKAGQDGAIKVLSSKDKEQLFGEHLKTLPRGAADPTAAAPAREKETPRKRGADAADGRDGGGGGGYGREGREGRHGHGGGSGGGGGGGSDYRLVREAGHDR